MPDPPGQLSAGSAAESARGGFPGRGRFHRTALPKPKEAEGLITIQMSLTKTGILDKASAEIEYRNKGQAFYHDGRD